MTTLTDAAAPCRWRGGVSPYGFGWPKLMMWWLIVTDGLLFGSFLAGYGFNRLAAGTWPDRSQVYHLDFVTVMTAILITSSATMATAVGAAQRRNDRLARRFLWLTLLGGTAFLGCQAVEWWQLIGEGASLSANPWGVPGFSAFFFLITGFHGTHVLVGLIVLAAVAIRATRGHVTPEGVELAGLYWHFVDLVWVFIFGCFYLI